MSTQPKGALLDVDDLRVTFPTRTGLIEAVHVVAPVQTIPPERIEWFTPAGGNSPIPAVHGLAAAMRAAEKQGSLLREIGFPARAITTA